MAERQPHKHTVYLVSHNPLHYMCDTTIFCKEHNPQGLLTAEFLAEVTKKYPDAFIVIDCAPN